MMRPLPWRLSFFHPASLIASGLGLGQLPRAPGSWASLAAALAAWSLTGLGSFSLGSPGSLIPLLPEGDATLGGHGLLALCGAAALVLGYWASRQVLAAGSDSADPGAVVIDEIAALWLALAALPRTAAVFAIAFVVFRIADILKPWPARMLERRLPGAAGIMADDLGAALYGVAAGWGLYWMGL